MADYVVGLTGGVASGKSEVTRRFEALGVAVADADLAARDAVAVGSEGLAEVVAAFGAGALAPDGSLDRPAMRRRVFADDAARLRLEAIVHPRVRDLLRAQCAAAPGPYAIAAIPLLAEALPVQGTGAGGRAAYPWLRRVLVVDVPVEVQRERLLARDGIDAALAERMIAAQATRQERLAIADDVIVNDGPLEALEAHVAALDARYRALAGAG
ncbi:dephospho-CoA kinase [Luteimonas marina]|uniref:Dephospho-CoA kinase n=1 Tax=Luteimonas marina TaxID=488485 RepID=A0A5C5TV27_9GAMM|nr:dephospho-CoA kinase [Luteimonas marina]TWT17526.1 dephospho-CoA kinase [Luteimonas marina]